MDMHGVPASLKQLIVAPRFAESINVVSHDQITQAARLHGGDLFRIGLTIAQVVHDDGDVCQTITALAMDQKIPRSPPLNIKL
jgi:hypothetical protein